MTAVSFQAWSRLWCELGAVADEGLYRQLLDCYAEPQRHYHTSKHLQECLTLLDEHRQLAEQPAEVAVALWFHDAIYDTQAKDNEALSAAWAKRELLGAGLPSALAESVGDLIMATLHDAVPNGQDAELLVDIDLAILGSSPERFAEYEAGVRREYAWVPQALYRQERGRVLQGFLERDAIYTTASFREARELTARENMRRSLQALGQILP